MNPWSGLRMTLGIYNRFSMGLLLDTLLLSWVIEVLQFCISKFIPSQAPTVHRFGEYWSGISHSPGFGPACYLLSLLSFPPRTTQASFPALPQLAHPRQPDARGGVSSPVLRSSVLDTLIHTTRVSTTVFPRWGSGPSLPVAVGRIQGSSAFTSMGLVTCTTNNRFKFLVCCPGRVKGPLFCALQLMRVRASSVLLPESLLPARSSKGSREWESFLHPCQPLSRGGVSSPALAPQSQLTLLPTISSSLECCPGELQAHDEGWSYHSQVQEGHEQGSSPWGTGPPLLLLYPVWDRDSEGWGLLSSVLNFHIRGSYDLLC